MPFLLALLQGLLERPWFGAPFFSGFAMSPATDQNDVNTISSGTGLAKPSRGDTPRISGNPEKETRPKHIVSHESPVTATQSVLGVLVISAIILTIAGIIFKASSLGNISQPQRSVGASPLHQPPALVHAPTSQVGIAVFAQPWRTGGPPVPVPKVGAGKRPDDRGGYGGVVALILVVIVVVCGLVWIRVEETADSAEESARRERAT